jgi:hypothetical protein
MEEQKYYFKISPENIKGDITTVNYTGDSDTFFTIDPCCLFTASTTEYTTGTTGVYLDMSYVLSGNTGGTSFLTGLTIPILFTQTAVDIGYYSTFDGAILQKDVIQNFLFSGSTTTPTTYSFYNTSDLEFKKFLELVTYTIDWGDGTSQPISGTTPVTHVYPLTNDTYTIVMTATSPWGISTVTKTVTVPFTNIVPFNPQGTATFTPTGGNWSGTPVSYDYIFTGDSNTNINDFVSSNYISVPFLVTGYTESTVNDLIQYGPKYNLYGGKFKLGIPVTGTSGNVGIYWGPDPTGSYTAYTISDIDYYDYDDGTTLYITESSGLTLNDMILSAITKNESYLNIIDQPEVQTNVYVDRGKLTALEYIERLGEVDNLGDLVKYGYGFFKVKNDYN